MARTEPGLRAGIAAIRALADEFRHDLKVPGDAADLNQELEKAGRVADYFELGELMCRDALERRESCGGHFREEFQTADGEALRDDDEFCHAAVWEHVPAGEPVRHVEPLVFESVKLATRNYK